MIKVFLAEDESIIRKSIRENIDWEKEGFQFCGEAGDGELALPLIKEQKPDILITDVKMPFMDGLELSELVKKELPSIKIIILSGFRDFDFAKKAISIGVTDYLSKPITSERLLSVIKQVGTRIEEEREEASLLKTYQEEMESKYRLEQNQFFNRILEKRESIPNLIREADEHGISIVAPYYDVLLCKFMQVDDSTIAQKQTQVAMDEAVSLFKTREGLLLFERGFEGIAIIIKASDKKEIPLSIDFVGNTLQAMVQEYPLTQYFGGSGIVVSRISEISKSYLEANKAFATRFFTKRNQIISMESSQIHEKIVMSNPSMLSWQRLENFFNLGTEEEIPGFSEQYMASIGLQNFDIPSFRNYVAMNIYYCTLAFPSIAALPKERIEQEIGLTPLNMPSSAELESYLSKVIRFVLSERDKQANRKNSQQVERARQYITEHVQEYGLSLNTVADHIHMSPNYFSTIFSQQAGETFIEFLTEARMQKAKELLMSTQMRPSDIAQEVGYQDSHYFGYLFKKTSGCTPKEYRDRGSAP